MRYIEFMIIQVEADASLAVNGVVSGPFSSRAPVAHQTQGRECCADMGRRVGVRILAAVLAVFWGLLFFGLIDLTVVFDQTPGFYVAYLLETGWGLLYTVLVAAPLVALAIKPGLTSLTAQLAVVAGCVGVTAIAAFSLGQLAPAAGLLLCSVLLDAASERPTVLSRGGLALWRGRSPRRPVLLVGCLAVLPAVVLAADLVLGYWQRRPPTDDDTWWIDHWPMQAALALAIPAVAILASLMGPGWRVSLWTAAVSAAWWGAVSLWYPTHAGSLGTIGGWAAIIWAVALLLSPVLPVRLAQRRPQ